MTNVMEYDKAWINYLNYKDTQFIAHHNKTIIINNDGQKIAELAATSNAFIIDDILYDKREKGFIAVDLQNIINK
jgi:hypothetical protein